ncbi:transposase-like protein [Pedobacter sp. UYP30]|uniref:transposase n=1 Tax=Pedobacter sp. UYP30 TaxID=1756400 RepID=UPI003398AD7B
MKKREFDNEFKKMAISLSEVKQSVKETAIELDLDASRLSKWRNDPRYKGGKKYDGRCRSQSGPTRDQAFKEGAP